MLSELHLLIPWWRENSGVWMRKWKDTTSSQKQGMGAGIGLTAFAAIAGGQIFSFAMGGILVNAMFWWMIGDEPWLMEWMRKRGHWIDIGLTVGAFFGSGGVWSAWMTSLMATAYFTVFRKIFAPREDCTSMFESIKNWWTERSGK